MADHSSKVENTTTLKIDAELYEEIRKFCDNEDRRLKDLGEFIG